MTRSNSVAEELAAILALTLVFMIVGLGSIWGLLQLGWWTPVVNFLWPLMEAILRLLMWAGGRHV